MLAAVGPRRFNQQQNICSQQKVTLSPQVLRISRHVLQRQKHEAQEVLSTPQLAEAESVTFEATRVKVSAARRRLERDPRSMLTWLDLSRGHAILGQTKKAIWAIERALYLAPQHRHALRAAARLFVHTGDFDRAHSLLTKNSRTSTDPWLMAAEISIAKIADHKPRFAGRARKLIDSGELPQEHLTELHSAVGTLEYDNGANRRARKDLRASLLTPTDNAVAQARWMSTQLSGIAISDSAFELPQGFEARCWRALGKGRWDEACTQCLDWLYDEPFSSRPAELGSYIGIALTADPVFAAACARAGLQAEPHHSMLRNNMVVALAYQDELLQAIDHFDRIKTPLPHDFPAYVYLATAGLLCFRTGDIDQGRQLYTKAETMAPADKKAHVAIFQAREELNLRTPEAVDCVARARHMSEEIENLRTKRLLVLLELQISSQSTGDEQVHNDDTRLSAHHRLSPILSETRAMTSGSDVVISSKTSDPTNGSKIMSRNKASHTVHRSSVSGRFVKEGYANSYPNRTQKESIPNPGHGDTGRSKKR